jgi:hypothetical protein
MKRGGAMTKTIEHLLKNSGLPGPRGNLTLLYSFIGNANDEGINECLSYYRDDLHDSPEEFVVMCGVAGLCVRNGNDVKKSLELVRPYASHSSWRIREAVAIGIQEISVNRTGEVVKLLGKWAEGNGFEKRAVVAALCEPKLLKDRSEILSVLKLLEKITLDFKGNAGKLSDNETSLKKTLGYGWSVAIAALPEDGKKYFESMASVDNRHIKWILKENLKKKRLSAVDSKWVEKMSAVIG